MTNEELNQSLSVVAMRALGTSSPKVWEQQANELMSFGAAVNPDQESSFLYWMGTILTRKPIGARIPETMWTVINYCMEVTQ